MDEEASARLMRNGLAVIAFCCVEDFVKKRSTEVSVKFGQSGFRFSSLTEKMQTAATVGAAEGMVKSVKRYDKSQRLSIVQGIARDISSTSGSGYTISEYAFGYDKSNLRDSDVAALAKCFGVVDFWSQVQHLANMMGYGGAVNYAAAFANAAATRHSAAHEPGFDTEIGDLNDWLDQAMAIVIAYDILISHRTIEFLAGMGSLSDGDVASRVKIRTVKSRTRSGGFAEYAPGKESGRAYRVGSDLDAVFSDALSRANANREMLVAFNAKQQPIRWFCG